SSIFKSSFFDLSERRLDRPGSLGYKARSFRKTKGEVSYAHRRCQGPPTGLGRGIDESRGFEESRTVKRKASLFAAAAALGLAVFLGRRLWAQAPAAPVQAPAQTRIALVNVVQAITNYHKFKTFQDELGRLAKPYKDREADLTKNLNAWQKELEKKDITPQQKEEAEKQI